VTSILLRWTISTVVRLTTRDLCCPIAVVSTYYNDGFTRVVSALRENFQKRLQTGSTEPIEVVYFMIVLHVPWFHRMQKKYSLGRYCQLHIPICFPVGVTSRYNRRGMHWNLQVFTSIRGMRERNKRQKGISTERTSCLRTCRPWTACFTELAMTMIVSHWMALEIQFQPGRTLFV
jgi:hypothetical protein